MSLLQSPTPKKNTPTKLLDGPNMIACLLKPEISGVPHNQKEGYSHSQQTYIYIYMYMYTNYPHSANGPWEKSVNWSQKV